MSPLQDKSELNNNMNGNEPTQVISTDPNDIKYEVKLNEKSTYKRNKDDLNCKQEEENRDEHCLTPVRAPFLYPIRWKESPWHLSSWISLSLTLDGRDKITKVIQYSSRFLGWYYTSDRWRTLQNKLTEARKSYRFGRTFIELQRLQKYLKSLNMSDSRTLCKKTEQNISTKHAANEITYFRTLIRSISPIIKLLGLASFWTADNIAYLLKIGFFGNHYHKLYGKRISNIATRSYFIGSIAGLCANLDNFLRSFYEQKKSLNGEIGRIHKLEKHKKHLLEQLYCDSRGNGSTQSTQKGQIHSDSFEDSSSTKKTYQEKYNNLTKEIISAKDCLELKKMKHMNICISLCKSICDVIVFSNNPGVDLHLKYRGKKMNEGIHSILGVISASTVLYNNFPDTKRSKET